MKAYRWHEQEVHKNLYEAEVSVLKRGLDGDFELIELSSPDKSDGRIKAIGKLRYDKDQMQMINIVFPLGYPYVPPNIISVKCNLDEEGNIVSPIYPHYFGNGNQYTNGQLCLLRRKDWDYQQHNIGWLLRKAQRWLTSATSENGFRSEEVVEEFPAPLTHQGQVLIPKKLSLPKNASSGQLFLKRFKPNHYILEHNILATSPFPFENSVEIFTWYSFDNGVTLKDILPASSPQEMIQQMIEVFKRKFGVNLLEGNTNRNVALHVPDDPNPWHFFKINIQKNGLQLNINLDYLLARNIENDLYLRTKDVFNDKILKGKKVTIIGLGALGSEVARSLARNSIGHFNLFDNDTFEIGNSVRHAADLFYIGQSKVETVKQLILRSNPNITINSYRIDVLDDNGLLEKSLSDSDICIVLTGEDSVDYFINDKFIPRFNIPFIFAGVSSGGLSGSIQVVRYQQTPCLRCLSKKGVDKLPKPKKNIEFKALPSEYGSCSSPALPGSEIDTKEIALQVSRVVLQELLSDGYSVYPPSKGNQYYWHGPMGSNKEAPFTWEIKNLKKYADCRICRSPE